MTKEEMNCFVQDLYDKKMQEGKHGHYETMFHVVHQAIKKEREACAEICDGFYLSWIDIQGRYEFMGEGASECAGAIRTRGQE